MALKSSAKPVKAHKIWNSKEASQSEGSEEDSNDEEITFIIKRFQYLAKKNKRFSSRSSCFRGSSSRDKNDDQKGCFNCKKSGHFIVDCPELQKDKSKNGSFKKGNFRNRFKKSLMPTWDKLDNEEDSKKDE